tara:strand:+ start:3113 stop:3574 length:462 start_codon:yes stop_codon:yes gene_type:complete
MHISLKTTALVLFLGGCGYVDAYEEAVYEHEPVYCYQSLAAVQCFKEPQHTDKQRLVNYYGPHPSRADEPDAPEVPELQAPTESVSKWVKDPEPVPQPRVRVSGVLRTVAFGKPLPKKTLDEETAAELKSLRITEPVPPSRTKSTTVELVEEK